jgi:DNA mismatch endonuclease (patch repair protein)
MSLVKGKGTKPELLVRKIVYALGFRYRLHVKNLPGKPDLVFRGKKKVIFVHGCYWHRHRDKKCKLARLPKSRLDFWLPKLEKNRIRDEKIYAMLAGMGWDILVVWECRINNREALRARLNKFLED